MHRYKIKLILFLACTYSAELTSQKINIQYNHNYVIEDDFHQAMQPSKNFKPDHAKTNKKWIIAHNLFNQFIHRTENHILPQTTIPKIIHHIWLGSKLPEKNRKLRETWQKMHPDWTFILWTDKEIEEFGLHNIDMYNATTNYGEKSDIARYEILYRMGGLYVDTDFECLYPFDLFHAYNDFYTGLGFGTNVTLFNGLIGSAPKHPILKLCIETMERKKNDNDSFVRILYRTGPYLFTRCALKYLTKKESNQPNATLFPISYFYPWPNYLRDKIAPDKIENFIQPHSVAMHYWEVSWNNGKPR